MSATSCARRRLIRVVRLTNQRQTVHSPLGTKFPIREVAGYATVADLIPDGHLLGFTVVWSMRLERIVGTDYELHRRLVLELGEDFDLDSRPLIRLTMMDPQQCSLTDDGQIMGLAIEDLRHCGMETARFCVFDYETSEFDVICSSVELSRAEKPGYP